MPFIFAIIIMMIGPFAIATVTIGSADCPVQFEGRVKDIIEKSGPANVFSTHTVVFKNLFTVKGQVGEHVSVDMLKHGPFEIERDKDYRIQLRGGNVCWVDKI